MDATVVPAQPHTRLPYQCMTYTCLLNGCVQHLCAQARLIGLNPVQLFVDIINRSLTANKSLKVLLDKLLQLPRAFSQLALQRSNTLCQLRCAAFPVKYRKVGLRIKTLLARQQLFPRKRYTALPGHRCCCATAPGTACC